MGERRRSQPVEIIEILTDQRVVARPKPMTMSSPQRVRMRPAMVALIAIAALVAMAVVARSFFTTSPRAALRSPTTTVPERVSLVPSPQTRQTPLTPLTPQFDANLPVVTVPTGGVCSDDRMPFHATFLPNGWSTDGSVWAGPDLLTGGTGTVRATHGDAVPLQGPPISSLTVLGVPAALAPLSEGYSVQFVLGSPSDLCDHWALVASKSVAAATLERIAEGMSPFGGGAQTLMCRQTYPTPDSGLDQHRVVLDALAIPSGVFPVIEGHLPSGVGALFAKASLAIRPGVAVTISLAAASRATVGMGWQSGAVPVAFVTMPACPGDAAWLVSIGGFWVTEPQCVTLEIEAAGVRQQVQLGFGVPCP